MTLCNSNSEGGQGHNQDKKKNYLRKPELQLSNMNFYRFCSERTSVRVLDLQKVLARVFYGVQLSKCFELSRVHYIWNLIHHKDENMAGLTPDKQTIAYLHENTYFVNLKNNYYWISKSKLLLFLCRTFYWALLWLSWNSFDLHFWEGGLSTLTLQINSN